MVSHSFSDRCHPSASFSVSLFNEFAAGRNARRTAESVLLVSSQSIIGRGTLAAGGFLVTSFRAKSRNLPCPAVIHVSVKMKIDVFVFRFPAVSRRPFMGLPERSLGCARDDETGSGWFLTRFQIAAIHPLPSVCHSSTSSQRGGMPEGLRRAFFSYRQYFLEGKVAIREYHLLKKGGEAATRALNPEP